MMYEPTQNEIADKANELYQESLKDDDYLIDALITNLPLVRKMLNANLADFLDAKLDLELAMQKTIYDLRDLENKARDMLIAEVGYIERTDVDTFKMRVHETRY
jgi:hypothetical protein